jgi:hypothetical protein
VVSKDYTDFVIGSPIELEQIDFLGGPGIKCELDELNKKIDFSNSIAKGQWTCIYKVKNEVTAVPKLFSVDVFVQDPSGGPIYFLPFTDKFKGLFTIKEDDTDKFFVDMKEHFIDIDGRKITYEIKDTNQVSLVNLENDMFYMSVKNTNAAKDTITIVASTVDGGSTEVDVTIVVVNVPNPPRLLLDKVYKAYENEKFSLDFPKVDDDDEKIFYTFEGLQDWITFDSTNSKLTGTAPSLDGKILDFSVSVLAKDEVSAAEPIDFIIQIDRNQTTGLELKALNHHVLQIFYPGYHQLQVLNANGAIEASYYFNDVKTIHQMDRHKILLVDGVQVNLPGSHPRE